MLWNSLLIWYQTPWGVNQLNLPQNISTYPSPMLVTTLLCEFMCFRKWFSNMYLYWLYFLCSGTRHGSIDGPLLLFTGWQILRLAIGVPQTCAWGVYVGIRWVHGRRDLIEREHLIGWNIYGTSKLFSDWSIADHMTSMLKAPLTGKILNYLKELTIS